MFRLGLLIRAIPSILYELGSLVWFSYRTGDRRTAMAATIWLVSTMVLTGFAINAVLSVIQGQPVELKGLFLAASVPISMWVAREVIAAVLLTAGKLLAIWGGDPGSDLNPERAKRI